MRYLIPSIFSFFPFYKFEIQHKMREKKKKNGVGGWNGRSLNHAMCKYRY